MASNGVRVKKANLQKGDLLFFDTSGSNNGRISHVGIYIGNGQFIHSTSSKRTWGVSISSLSEAYYMRTYVTASRVI
jgi:cell wall-associated NlpC family hydrolase